MTRPAPAISGDEIKALRELLAKATPGPWSAGRMDAVSYDGNGDGPYKNVYATDPRGGIHEPTGNPLPYTVARGEGDEDECRANAALIEAAVNALPALLTALEAERERVRVLQDENVRLQRQVEGWKRITDDAIAEGQEDFNLLRADLSSIEQKRERLETALDAAANQLESAMGCIEGLSDEFTEEHADMRDDIAYWRTLTSKDTTNG